MFGVMYLRIGIWILKLKFGYKRDSLKNENIVIICLSLCRSIPLWISLTKQSWIFDKYTFFFFIKNVFDVQCAMIIILK